MKKTIIYGLSFAFIAATATSCGKTTKGKMSNEWSATELSSSSTTTNADGDVETTSWSSTDGATFTMTQTYTPSGGTSSSLTLDGTVNEFSYTINKDGSWSSVTDMTFSIDLGGGISQTQQTRDENSGTWTLLGKNKTGELKKNERVVFNTLSSTSTETSTITGSTPDTETSTNTYAEGENPEVMMVVESKGKMLKLKKETNNAYTFDGDTETTVSTMEITMEEKGS